MTKMGKVGKSRRIDADHRYSGADERSIRTFGRRIVIRPRSQRKRSLRLSSKISCNMVGVRYALRAAAHALPQEGLQRFLVSLSSVALRSAAPSCGVQLGFIESESKSTASEPPGLKGVRENSRGVFGAGSVTAADDFARGQRGGPATANRGGTCPERYGDAAQAGGNSPVVAGCGPNLRLTVPPGSDTIGRR